MRLSRLIPDRPTPLLASLAAIVLSWGAVHVVPVSSANANGAIAAVASAAQSTTVLTGVYTIQQASTRRYLDAYQSEDRDFAVVTRPRQDGLTQRWIVRAAGNQIVTISQRGSQKYLDAYLAPEHDFGAVMRPLQPGATQQWRLIALGEQHYRLQQMSGKQQFLDAYDYAGTDFRVVTRPPQPNLTQVWIFRRVLSLQ